MSSEQPPRRWWRRLIPVLILILAVGLFSLMKNSAEEAPAAKPGERVWVVATQTVQPASLAPTLALYGQVVSPHAVTLTAEVAATVREIKVLDGASVNAGDSLLRFDDADLQIAAQQADARLRDAEAQLSADRSAAASDRKALRQEQELLRLAEAAAERSRALKRRDLTAQARVDEAARGVAQARLSLAMRQLAVTQADARRARLEAARDQTQSAARQAQLNLARSEVTAPIAGRISGLNVQTGQRVAPGQVLMTLASAQDLEIRAQIPASRLADLPPADAAADATPALLAVGQIGAQTFTARLVRIGSQVASGSTGVPVYLQVTSGQQWLQPGRTVALDLQLPALPNVIAAPRESLYGGDRVYLLRDGRMHSSAVEVVGERRQADGALQLLLRGDELQAGAKLITTLVPSASDGLPVREPTPTPATNAKPAAAPAPRP